MIDRSNLSIDDPLPLELLVKGEYGPFRAPVDVACAAPARSECPGVGITAGKGSEGGRAGCGGRRGDVAGVDVFVVACATAARVNVVGAGDGGVRFGEVEWHALCLLVLVAVKNKTGVDEY